jgi:hypothetical protein
MNNSTMQSLLLAVYIKSNDYVLMMEAIELLSDDTMFCDMDKTVNGDITIHVGMTSSYAAPLYIIKVTAKTVRIVKNEETKNSVLRPIQIRNFLGMLRKDSGFLEIGQVSKIEFILSDAKYVDLTANNVTVTDKNSNYFVISKRNGHNSLYLNYQGRDWEYELETTAHQLAHDILK